MHRSQAPLLITGATGTLGQAFRRACLARGLQFILTSRSELDIADRQSVETVLHTVQPWAVINTAGYVRVDDAEEDQKRCRRENVLGPVMLAEACRARGSGFVTFSSDLVFDGREERPYLESDAVAPLNVYGSSKQEAEREVLRRMPWALVIRTSAFFGPWDAYNFAAIALRELRARRPFEAASDQTVSPTYVPHLTDATLDLLIDGEGGIWHLASAGALSWHDFAARVARSAGVDARTLRAVSTPPRRAIMPRYSVLGSERGQLLPALEHAIANFVEAGV